MNSCFYPSYAVATVNFLEALNQNQVSAMNNLVGPLKMYRGFIRAISVVAKQNFGPEFSFFSTAVGDTGNPATDYFVSRWGFTASMGAQLAGAGLWRYYVDGLSIPFADIDGGTSLAPASVHVVMQNTEATAKLAGSDGAMSATFWLEPQQAW